MRRTLSLLVFFGLIAGARPDAAIAAPWACPASPALARLVAVSDIVAVGRSNIPAAKVEAAAREASPNYLDLSIDRPEVLKGLAAERLVVTVYPKDGPYRPSLAALRAASDEPSLMFLVQSGDALYFAASGMSGLSPATSWETAKVTAEIARQDHIIQDWRPDPTLSRHAQVHRLIDQLAHLSERGDGQPLDKIQARIVAQLVALGPDAVPTIIDQMDDRRPLTVHAIALANTAPGGFESIRHHGPEQIVDALAAILGEITGQNFGFIENGGSDAERRASIEGWRVYAADLHCRSAPHR
jgi:hypothetical protein